MTDRHGLRWRAVFVAAAAAVLVAILGASMTELGPWYQSLEKPAWQPPDWLFGPVWTVIFALTALAGYLTWRSAPDRRVRERILALYALNALLNILWTIIFFRVQRPDWALIEVAFLWLSIVALIVVSVRYAKPAGGLLAPYLAWVTFAAILNWSVVRLNEPF